MNHGYFSYTNFDQLELNEQDDILDKVMEYINTITDIELRNRMIKQIGEEVHIERVKRMFEEMTDEYIKKREKPKKTIKKKKNNGEE